MNVLQQTGEAQLLAVEGQAQIARALATSVAAVFRSLAQALVRQPGQTTASGLPRR